MSCPICDYLACDEDAGDRMVRVALQELHGRPDHAWTVIELARVAGASRSLFAERFHQKLGSSPMQYLRKWRMLLAANHLERSKAPLVRIAEKVGYVSDSAFSRAFRREYGMPPATWRRRSGA